MSNCIDLYDARKTLSSRDIDIGAFLHRVETATKDSDHGIPWWFLQNNVQRKANPGEIEIAFGQGRSSHTNRDFIATMLWLSQFAINPFTLVFRVRDEFDGFESEGTQTVQFIERKCLVEGWMKEFAEWTA